MKDNNNLYIEPSTKTPQVDFNALTGELILSGRSIPENATEVYQPVLDWINEYIKEAKQNTNLRLNLEYFNTATSIWLAKIVRSLSKIERAESMLMIHLYFGIEEFDSMDVEDIKDTLSHLVDIIANAIVSIGVKLYGTDSDGNTLKESMVLI